MRHGTSNLVLVLAFLSLAACVNSINNVEERVAIAAAPHQSRVDDELNVRLRGLRAGESATVVATLTDAANRTWQSSGEFRADRSGKVDPRTQPSVGGTYYGIDQSGLLWSMLPLDAAGMILPQGEFVEKAATDPRHSLVPILARDTPYKVVFRAIVGGTVVAQTSVSRRWNDTGVTKTEVSEGEIRGIFYQPVKSNGIGIVSLAGSGGGVDVDWAPLLAARGYSVLALGYFHYKDRPPVPSELPIEYFAQSLRWMRGKLEHDRIALLGVSRGTEAAILTAAHFPDLVKAVIVVAPTHLSTPGFHPQKGLNVSTWSFQGKAIAFSPFPPIDLAAVAANYGSPDTPLRQAEWYRAMYSRPGETERFGLPVEKMTAPLLMLSGEDDQIWPSTMSSQSIADRLAAHCFQHEVRLLTFANAGHGLWRSPNTVTTFAHLDYHNLARAFTTAGGSPAGNARAAKAAFVATDVFLRQTLLQPKPRLARQTPDPRCQFGRR